MAAEALVDAATTREGRHPEAAAGPAAEEAVVLDDDDDDDDDDSSSSDELRLAHRAASRSATRRRSSIGSRLAAVADAGGANSFRCFARSWRRAASFAEVLPRRPSLVFAPDLGPRPDDDDDDDDGADDGDGDDGYFGARRCATSASSSQPSPAVFDAQPLLATPPSSAATAASGHGYGSFAPGSPCRRAADPAASATAAAAAGRSTLPQSVFNAANALVGVGLLSLPRALALAGWLPGLAALALMAAVAAHTARLLGRCMRAHAAHAAAATYSDLASLCFGPRARAAVAALFSLELVAACAALVILFADSLAALAPGLAAAAAWKALCAVLLLGLEALPLRWLSYTSVVGIFATMGIVVLVVVDGLVKNDPPGSLRHPAPTHALPENWLALPLAYGLLASPWGAHCVFPSIYRDMRQPRRWATVVDVSFSFSYALDTSLAVVGLLMYGDAVADAVTTSLLQTPGLPPASAPLVCLLVAVIALSKLPLSCRPLVDSAHHLAHRLAPRLPPRRRRPAARLLVVALLLLVAVAFPAFDAVCAFLGAALCSLVSVVLPVSFYLALFAGRLSVADRLLAWLILVLFSLLAVVGTVWTFLPRRLFA